MRREIAYLKDILDCIAKLESYLSGVDQTRFLAEHMLQDAVIRNLEIIGEAVKCLPEVVKQRQPQVPWKQVTRTRDLLIHHYFRVDLQIVWSTVTQDLAPLKTAIAELLKELDI